MKLNEIKKNPTLHGLKTALAAFYTLVGSDEVPRISSESFWVDGGRRERSYFFRAPDLKYRAALEKYLRAIGFLVDSNYSKGSVHMEARLPVRIE